MVNIDCIYKHKVSVVLRHVADRECEIIRHCESAVDKASLPGKNGRYTQDYSSSSEQSAR